ncbi:MAG TPA: tetratricopeptide repeat protein [Thermoanaerobaculia bacterium]
MKSLFAVALLAVSLGKFWQPTNSHAANRRGMATYEQKQYDAAAQSFAEAQRLAPDATNAFNLGTAQIASGNRDEGAATLATLGRDADALYNRGNAALADNKLDEAVRSYIETLKLRPEDAQAKRNLEIALNKKDSAQRGGAKGPQQKGNQSPQQQPQSPSAGDQPQQQAPSRGEADQDALLRSVQQQEQEELRRMKKPSRSVRVGW